MDKPDAHPTSQSDEQIMTNKQFSTFDDTLIDRYFNAEGKAAIDRYAASVARRELEKLNTRIENQFWMNVSDGHMQTRNAIDEALAALGGGDDE